MYTIQTLLIILHVAAAAAYFGMGLPLTRWARAAQVYTGDARMALVAQGVRTVRMMGILLIATAVLALGAFLIGGGFGAYGPAYHASIGLMVMLLGIQFALVAPAWRALAAGQNTAPRVAIATGVSHFLWFVLLILMFWNRVGVTAP